MYFMATTNEIQVGKELRYENVASFRKKMSQSGVQHELKNFATTIQQTGAQKNGPLISATFGIEQVNGEQYVDIEFLIPLDRPVNLPDGYVFKPIFHLLNAVCTRFTGKIEQLQITYNEMMAYINSNRLQQITVGYNVNMNEDQIAQGADPVIDVYIGVSPNIL